MAHDLFRMHDCEVLADALADVTGWPVVLISDSNGGWCHAGVASPSGQVLDVDGGHDRDEWLEAWAGFMDGDDAGIEIRRLHDLLGADRFRDIEPPSAENATIAAEVAKGLASRVMLRQVRPVR